MKLFSRIIGEGPDVLILHGLFGMNDNWNSLGKQWAEDCGMRMHLLDLRNHGQSPHSPEHTYKAMSADVVEYLDDHSIDSAIVIGHSMGGKVAMRMAVDHPERVARLCVVDIAPKGYPVHHQEIVDAMRTLNFDEISSRKDADDTLALSMPNLMMRQFLLKSLHWESEDRLAWRFNLDAIEANLEMVGEAMEESAMYEGTTLFIRGAKSGYIKDEDEALLKAHFPKSRLYTVEGAGHWVHAEKPKEMYRVICEFLS
ncbi:MAG: alpha/beta fold hydrolase [Bacteroidetes bacterium]|nr:MAG: alpha/beta fold hydrolase [Bacteroidota bacterium]